ncbi:unnamed protein product [Prorocentrum cordatum]|uniref:BRCT domain-containing protein n=1 Tax=Prorocentrum cordatum TaxID=2364126 RepID=A0ABN9WY35_9DINO|nr:unnamed protein product [Polarella glacialis]
MCASLAPRCGPLGGQRWPAWLCEVRRPLGQGELCAEAASAPTPEGSAAAVAAEGSAESPVPADGPVSEGAAGESAAGESAAGESAVAGAAEDAAAATAATAERLSPPEKRRRISGKRRLLASRGAAAGRQPPCFLASGVRVSAATRKLLWQRLGAGFADGWSVEVTHLVSDSFRRTAKMMCALCAGVPVVRSGYLDACLRTPDAGTQPDEEAFALRDRDGEEALERRLGLDPGALSLELAQERRRRQGPLLDGVQVFASPRAGLQPEDVAALRAISHRGRARGLRRRPGWRGRRLCPRRRGRRRR